MSYSCSRLLSRSKAQVKLSENRRIGLYCGYGYYDEEDLTNTSNPQPQRSLCRRCVSKAASSWAKTNLYDPSSIDTFVTAHDELCDDNVDGILERDDRL